MKTQALSYLENLITDETSKKELDLIEFIKKCVKEYKERETQKCITEDYSEYIEELFDKFYNIYRRKGSKIQGLKTFKKKLIKLKSQEEILEKARKIVKIYMAHAKQWDVERKDNQFIPFISTWLNANIPD